MGARQDDGDACAEAKNLIASTPCRSDAANRGPPRLVQPEPAPGEPVSAAHRGLGHLSPSRRWTRAATRTEGDARPKPRAPDPPGPDVMSEQSGS